MTTPPGGQWHLADADPLAAGTLWLRGHARFQELLEAYRTGQGLLMGRGQESGPPYPLLRLTGVPGGTMDAAGHQTSASVLLEVLGDPDGRPGPHALRRVAVAALEALREVEEEGAVVAGVVLTATTADTMPGWAPLASGQGRYIADLTLHSHPARILPTGD